MIMNNEKNPDKFLRFPEWISKGKDSYSFSSKFCVWALWSWGNMESTFLKNHMGQHKHLAKRHETQSELQLHTNDKLLKSSMPSNNNGKQKQVSRSAIPTAVHEAEVLLALSSVSSHIWP